VTDPAYERRKALILGLMKKYDQLARVPQQQLHQVIQPDLVRLIRVARKSSWWAEALAPAGRVANKPFLEILRSLPILKREQVQDYGRWMQVYLPGSKPEHYVATQTSGSTGKPVVIVRYQPGNVAEHRAIQLMDAVWQKRDMSEPMAYFKNTEPDARAGHGRHEPFSYIGPTGPVSYMNISKATLGEMLDHLEEHQSSYLLLNGIVIRLLAQEYRDNPRPNIKLKQILSWAEKVEPSLRELVREQFGAKICDRYSAEEFGYLAIQCPDSEHLHPMQFHNYIEILNDKDEPCQIGETGRVIVTGLRSFGMPLIRYELGDLASWSEPCEHGIALPVFSPDIVRIRDAEVDENGRVVRPRIDRSMLGTNPAITDFQLVRFDDAVVILLRTKRDLTNEEQEQLKSEMAANFTKIHNYYILASQNLDWLRLWKRKIVHKVAGPAPAEISFETMKKIVLSDPAGTRPSS
jgi:phenylacetate-CoA ligase